VSFLDSHEIDDKYYVSGLLSIFLIFKNIVNYYHTIYLSSSIIIDSTSYQHYNCKDEILQTL